MTHMTKAILALTVAVMVGNVQLNIGGKTFSLPGGQSAYAADNAQPQAPPPVLVQPPRQPTPPVTTGWRTPAGSLDRAQYSAFYAAVQARSNETAAIQAKITTAQKELVEATLAENYDENVVRAKTEALLKLQGEMILIRANALATLSPTLKPEQRDQLVNTSGAMMLTSGFMSFYGSGGVAPGGSAPGAVWTLKPGPGPGQPMPLNPAPVAKPLPLQPAPKER
jgi:Spy/CpxP family protein refolding chaperone